jgi:hypothetical protein
MQNHQAMSAHLRQLEAQAATIGHLADSLRAAVDLARAYEAEQRRLAETKHPLEAVAVKLQDAGPTWARRGQPERVHRGHL